MVYKRVTWSFLGDPHVYMYHFPKCSYIFLKKKPISLSALAGVGSGDRTLIHRNRNFIS